MPTPRYRSVGGSSSIDESLFGSPTSSSSKGSSRRIVTGPLAPTDIVISQSELNRIQGSSIIKTEAQLMADKERALELKAERERKAGERKLRMKELEKKAVLAAKKSDEEVAAEGQAAALRAMAQEKIDNNSDVVKMLNSMSARAVAFSIRDRQLGEKEEREERERELDRRLDIMMEIDRLKDLHGREEIEKQKVVKRHESRKVITEQIEYRRRMGLIAAEAREQENQGMRNLMNKYKDEDAAIAAVRAVEIERSRAEVISANEDAIRRKREARLAEKKEMEDILIYQALKDAELAKREEEEAAAEKVKKDRQAKLLAQQERAQNNAGKLDELRARRAAEERERKARQSEREKASKVKSEMEDLLRSRAKQAADKKSLAEREKIAEEEEYRNALKYMQSMAEREEREKEYKHNMSMQHREKLFAQIDANERRNASHRGNKFDEGTKFRQELIAEEAKLSVIRDKMVRDLEAKGANPKYLSEMKTVDIGRMLRR